MGLYIAPEMNRMSTSRNKSRKKALSIDGFFTIFWNFSDGFSLITQNVIHFGLKMA